MRNSICMAIFIVASICILPCDVLAHCMCDRTEPRVGAKVKAPSVVKIWFDGDVESALSKISVKNDRGKVLDKGDVHINPKDPTLLEVSLNPLTPGKYFVHWSAVSRDTHRTQGDYSFMVE